MPYSDLNKQRISQQQWYLKNKEKYYQSQKKSRQKRVDFVRTLREKPCVDCGNIYPWYVMEFDHRNGKEKLFDIGQAVHKYGIKRLTEEIAKCDVVCANCHAARTYLRRQVVH